jgi:hypothetical protein
MTITTDWIDSFKDPSMQKPLGKGAFFSGVVLGFIARCQAGKDLKTTIARGTTDRFIARCQAGKDGSLSSAPLFKKLSFGKLKKRELSSSFRRCLC